jgi:hypothetical protein
VIAQAVGEADTVGCERKEQETTRTYDLKWGAWSTMKEVKEVMVCNEVKRERKEVKQVSCCGKGTYNSFRTCDVKEEICEVPYN